MTSASDKPGVAVSVGTQQVQSQGIGINIDASGRRPSPKSTLLDLGRLIGRADDLAVIAGAFAEPTARRLILVGEPGVGKTHLANAYGMQNDERYPGGTFFIPFNADPAAELAKLVPSRRDESIADRAQLALVTIAEQTLLIYDNNVASESELARWLPPPNLPAHVLVTTTDHHWGRHHTQHRVQRFSDADTRACVVARCAH